MGHQVTNHGKFEVHDLDAPCPDPVAQQEAAARPTDGGQLMSGIEARMGRPIIVAVFKVALSRLNQSLIFQLSKGDPTKYGVYVRTIVSPRHPEGLRFITGMESGLNLGGSIDTGIMPEFSIIESDPVEVVDGDVVRTSAKFKREIRGWRTVLAALHLAGLLTESQIESTFQISHGRDSNNWQRRMHPAITTVSEE